MKIWIYCICLICWVKLSFAQAELQNLQKEFASDPDLKGAAYSWCLMEASSDKIVQEFNAELSLVPASTLKLLTTSAALMALGKNFKYETQIYLKGNVVNGNLNGDLVLKGGGDPSLGSRHFPGSGAEFMNSLVSALQKAGVKSVSGNFICDDSYLDNAIPSTWIWADLSNYYGVAPHGINYRDNLYTLYFKTAEAGSASEIIRIEPKQSLEFKNKVKAGGKGDNAFIYGSPNEQERIITGTLPAGQNAYGVDGAMPNPWFALASECISNMLSKGIQLNGKILLSDAKMDYSSMKKIFTHQSPSLERIVQMCNLHSDNLYAETLLRTLGVTKGAEGTNQEGLNCVRKTWEERGLKLNGVYLDDGSGLSRFNAVSSQFLCRVLSKVSRDSSLMTPFYNSLPWSGSSGSMNGMFAGTYLENNIRAKSGYMTRARSYAGYFTDKQGRQMCFAVIFNNYGCSPTEAKKKMTRLIKALAD